VSAVVFLRAVNVGTANRCRPAAIAKNLSKFEVVNIGAVGTFVVHKETSESVLRAAFARELPFKCEIMICPGRDILKLAAADPFSEYPPDPAITRFVNVLARPVPSLAKPDASLCLPSPSDWLVKVIGIRGRYVLGLYRRDLKAIGLLGKLEKEFGVPATNRNWNTMEKVAQVLQTTA
jgi:uncharacterized protein (DUF1697 family)